MFCARRLCAKRAMAPLFLALAGCPSPVAPSDTGPIQPIIIDDGTEDPVDPGQDYSQALVDALGNSVWHGQAVRGGVTRTIEQHFRAWDGEWAEVVNPVGPAWHQQLREIDVRPDGVTVDGTVVVPSGWPADPENGAQHTWTFEIVQGSPRVLRITRDSVVETYVEGTAAMPMGGLTATARVWNPGDAVDQAFCDSGVTGFDYDILFDFARGQGLTPRAQDVVTGTPVGTWHDLGDNSFAVADVPGFDMFGGTDVTDRFNFVVQYRGTFQHPGGAFRVRETDDTVEDGIWVFVNDGPGYGGEDHIFFETHGFYWWDATEDAPSIQLPPGAIAVEVIIARCTEPMEDVSLEFAFGDGPWQPFSALPTTPHVEPSTFPEPF